MSNARWNVIAHFSFSERAARTNRAVCSKSIVRSCFRQPITKPLAPFSFKILISEFWLFFLEHQKLKNGFSNFKKISYQKSEQGWAACLQWWRPRRTATIQVRHPVVGKKSALDSLHLEATFVTIAANQARNCHQKENSGIKNLIRNFIIL